MTDRTDPPTAPEMSRPFAVDELGYEPVTVNVETSPAERAALARRFELLELRSLTAQLRLRWRQRGKHLEAAGSLEAELVQTCVVSLEPVESRVTDTFRAEFQRGLETTAEVDLLLDPGDDDPPEPLDGPLVDLGELVAQHLSLAIDPYPRAPGVSFEDLQAVLPSKPEAEPEVDHPFGKLAALRNRR